MGRSRPDGRARGRARGCDSRRGRRPRAPRGVRGGGRARRGGLAAGLDGLDRGRHDEAGSDPRELRLDPREGAFERRRGPGAGAVPHRASRAHRCRAGLEGPQVGEARPAVHPHPRRGRASLPGRPCACRGRAGRQGLDHEAVRQAGGRGDLQGPRPEEDRRRQAAPGRTCGGGDPARRVRRAGEPAHARLGALHARADADHDAADARHDEGGSEDRRPLPRAEPPVHAPLQLPALLGRGDGLHAWPEAA